MSNNFHFLKLDAIRGFAAIIVLLYHCVGQLQIAGINIGAVFRFGQEGVIIFFILSGFLIEYTTNRSGTIKGGEYFTKRFLRIYPVLVMALAAIYVIECMTAGQLVAIPWRDLVGTVFMLDDNAYKPNAFCAPVWGDGALWSLTYEVWFYILYFPLMRLIPQPKQTHVVGCLGIAAALANCLWPSLPLRILIYLPIWWLGVDMARSYRARTLSLWSIRAILTYLSVITLIFVPAVFHLYVSGHFSFTNHHVYVFRHLAAGLWLTGGIFAWRYFNYIGFSFTVGLFSIVAPFSYALYILHMKTLMGAEYLSFLPNPYVELTAYIMVTFGLAWLIECKAYPVIRRYLYPVIYRAFTKKEWKREPAA